MGLQDYPPLSLTPDEFEMYVEEYIRGLGGDLNEFEVKRLDTLSSSDDEYVMDVTARFEALGAAFLVLIECKRHQHAIKRETVQILRDKVSEVGAHKGMIISTSGFQSGAVAYAAKHGIALIHVADGRTIQIAKSQGGASEFLPGTPPIVSWLTTIYEGEVAHILLLEDSAVSIDSIFDENPFG